MNQNNDVIIYATNDYSIFKGVIGNRKVYMNHVNNLVQSIAKNNLLAQNPIIVNKDMKIVDGQHRLKAAEVNSWTIYYTIANDAQLPEIQLLNSTAKPWTGHDYLNSYADIGVKDYQLLREYHKDTGVVLTNLMIIFSGVQSSSSSWGAFKRGEYKVANHEEAEDFLNAYIAFKPYVETRVFNDREFLIALRQMATEISLKEFLEKLQEAAMPIEHRATTREYLRQFEEVLNWGQRKHFVRLF